MSEINKEISESIKKDIERKKQYNLSKNLNYKRKTTTTDILKILNITISN